MGTKYSGNATSGYNSTPPADDGTVSEANKVKWSTIKTKLTDPIKTFGETIDSELTTHFDHGPTALTSNTTLDATHYEKFIQVSSSGVTLTLTDAATLGAGWNCHIFNTDTNTTTIGRATGGDTINGTAANYTLQARSGIKVFVNSAGTGFEVRQLINPLGDNTISSTDAGASIGPNFSLYRDSASPAANDLIGGYNLDGEDSAGNRETYAGIYGEIVDPGTTTEDGRLHVRTVVAGTLASRGYIGAGLVMTGATDGDKGAGTGNFTAVYDDGVLLTPATAANGSSLVLLGSATAAGAASNLEYTAVDDTYAAIYLYFDHIYASSAGGKLIKLQYGDSGSYFTSNYEYHVTDTDSSSSSYAALVSASYSGILLANLVDTTATRGLNGGVWISRPGGATRHGAKVETWEITNGGALKDRRGVGGHTGTSALTRVRIITDDGTNLSGGTMYVFGLKKS